MLEPGPALDDGLLSSEVDVVGRYVAERFVLAPAIVVLDSAILPLTQPTQEHIYFAPTSSLVHNLYLNRLLHSALLD